jgi:hypothetical protein
MKHRGGSGIIAHKITEKSGALCGIATVSEDDDIMLITNEGTIIRTAVNSINVYSRSAAGVIVMRLDEGAKIYNFTRLEKDEEIEEETKNKEEELQNTPVPADDVSEEAAEDSTSEQENEEFTDEVTTLSPTSVADRMTGKAQYHTRVATEIFKDYPLFGVGGWGYKHFCLTYMTDAERKQLQTVGGVNVHNDYLQILCEHGIVGGLLLVAVLFMLFVPFFNHWGHRLKIAHFTKDKDLPRPTALFCVPAVVVGVLGAAAANLVHAFGDCVFRSPAVLTQFLLLLASVEGFLSDGEEGK